MRVLWIIATPSQPTGPILKFLEILLCTFYLSMVVRSKLIKLAKPLVYEKVNSYTLTLQVRNSLNLVAEARLNIKVIDENN